jgi:NAD-dependent dihydropyrimidine dehydrogenase PreA subunit
MAYTDKNIVITPNIGSANDDPKIIFGAGDSTAAQSLAARIYPTSNGTFSIEGPAGQLFSVTNNLTGTLFSVNDVSGMPSIEVLDTGDVKLGQYSGNVAIGTDTANNKLTVLGNAGVFGSINATRSTDGTRPLTVTNPSGYLDFSGYYATGGYIRSVATSGSSYTPFVLGSYTVRMDGNGNGIGFFINNTNLIGIGSITPVGKLSVASANSTTSFPSITAWNNTYSLFGADGANNVNGGAVGIAYDSTQGGAITSLVPGTAWKNLNLSSNDTIFNGGGTERVRITSSGDVGIGANTPNSRLHIAYSNTSTSAYYQGVRESLQNTSNTVGNFGTLSFTSAGGNDAAAIWTVFNAHTSSAASGDLVFGTTNAGSVATERMRISAIGNVAISTTTVSSSNTTGALTVAGGVGIRGTAYCVGSRNNTCTNCFVCARYCDVGSWHNYLVTSARTVKAPAITVEITPDASS